MLIKVGDNVSVNLRRKILPREGKVTNISIATTADDPAGEAGMQVKEYDTTLDYAGSIDYETENGDQYWAYFSQIEAEDVREELAWEAKHS